MATARLTEEEVHAACAEIAAQGERPTAIKLLENLGRGSLTTITKYLNSWNATDEAQAIKAEELPVLVQLPEVLSKEGEDLLKKMWHTAKGLADEELDIQREALKQAELANQAKVEEAFKFSEAQTMKIERLEDVISDLRNAHKITSSAARMYFRCRCGFIRTVRMNSHLQFPDLFHARSLRHSWPKNKAIMPERLPVLTRLRSLT